MEKYSKIGLPALIGALILFVFAVKTFVNIRNYTQLSRGEKIIQNC